MQPILFVILLFFSSFSFAQQPLTAQQINRLADAGKVYGYIKYFHPWLQYKTFNWDSAFAANVEGIIKAKNGADYKLIMQKLLSPLNDGLTTVANFNGSSKDYNAQQLIHYLKDSILYIQMNDFTSKSEEELGKALQELKNAKGAIIDLRSPANSRFYNMLGHGTVIDWYTSFFNGVYSMPSIRTVSYIAFPGEWGNGYNNSVFKESMIWSNSGDAKKEVPLVFIVAKEDDIPLIAIKLQEKGKAKILQEEGHELLPGSSLYFYISDSLLIQMRTGEAVNSDGSLLTIKPDAIFSHDDSIEIVFSKARNLLTNSTSKIPDQKWHHPMPEDHSLPYSNGAAYPSIGYRMLGAAKMFAVIQHFYASKIGITKNWESAYKEAISNFIAAKDSVQYWKAVAEFHAFTKDSHGFIANSDEGFSLRLNPIIQGRGTFIPPVFTAIVENKIVITGIFNDSVCKSIGIKRGDIVLSINGDDPMQMIERSRKYQNAGNIGSQNFYLGSFILFGKEGEAKKLKIQNSKGGIQEVMMPTLSEFKGNWLADKYVSGMFSHNHQPTAKYLEGDIAYVDITSGLKDSDIDSIFRIHKNIKGLIVDMRGYPQGTYLELAALFQDNMHKVSPEITYKVVGNIPASSPNVVSVNRFGSYFPAEEYKVNYQTRDKIFNLPFKFVVLTNGSGQSNGDYIPFVDRTSFNATLIGSPTAGAMTTFTNYTVPGNIRLWLSNGPIERKGILPDVYVTPTIKGIQAGKDEVLQRAIKYLQTGR
jgi:C-terminal processing protease CtpA/Prc